MKKTILSVSAALMALLMLLSLGACKPREAQSDEPVRALIVRFEDACHQLDANEILDCVNPDIAQPLKFAAGVAGEFAGLSSDELLGMLSGMLQNAGDIGDNKQFFSSLHMTVDQVEMDASRAKARVTVTYTTDEKEYSREATVVCIERDERWYIAEFRF